MRQMENAPRRRPPKKLRKLKKIEKEAFAVTLGAELAKFKAHSRKPLIQSVKEHIGKMVDNCNALDVMAVVSGAYVIHQLIMATPQLQQQAKNFVWTAAIALPFAAWLTPFITAAAWSQAAQQAPQIKPEEIFKREEWKIWLISFFIAYILVRHGGQILGLVKDGTAKLSEIVGLMLA